MKQSATRSTVRSRLQRPRALELHIGPQSRRLFVLDNVVKPQDVSQLYKFFRNLPYRYLDSDRFDTTDYRHFGYTFEEEPPTDHPVVALFFAARPRVGEGEEGGADPRGVSQVQCAPHAVFVDFL